MRAEPRTVARRYQLARIYACVKAGRTGSVPTTSLPTIRSGGRERSPVDIAPAGSRFPGFPRVAVEAREGGTPRPRPAFRGTRKYALIRVGLARATPPEGAASSRRAARPASRSPPAISAYLRVPLQPKGSAWLGRLGCRSPRRWGCRDGKAAQSRRRLRGKAPDASGEGKAACVGRTLLALLVLAPLRRRLGGV